ncbi:MAG TPA: FkbM family methyltransferase [Chitinophagales bacterium]|nr:FkbM family methyltransferase [Chitinophagales bacterium]HMW11864.1 FkbM family methyltransferase [Chitinophagales bacterium]HMX59007.1 FkbM family methyltransferase [Chitinophagales bacterium]HMY22358.1 FkbM family methyltransferase [Chitinophagales bacterium]HMZ32938.1 FkbM family methyltransferase [Chitinophagales bacterium]
MKRLIIKIFNFLGFDIYQKPGKFYKNKLKLLTSHQVNCILDVGANEGQYALKLRKYGYKGKIISFEPQLDTFKKLEANAQRFSNWTTHHYALGASDETTEINVSQNTVSSSFLEIKDIHVAAAQDAKYVRKESIAIKRLDSIFDTLELHNQNIFLKIDTQGFEMEVLKGATSLFDKIIGFQIEMSLVQLYENEILFDEIIAYLKQHNFGLYQIETGVVDETTGRMLQIDGIFFKN